MLAYNVNDNVQLIKSSAQTSGRLVVILAFLWELTPFQKATLGLRPVLLVRPQKGTSDVRHAVHLLNALYRLSSNCWLCVW
jgi:hypothetical protein